MKKYVMIACLSIACFCGVFFYSPVVSAGTLPTVGTVTTFTVREFDGVRLDGNAIAFPIQEVSFTPDNTNPTSSSHLYGEYIIRQDFLLAFRLQNNNSYPVRLNNNFLVVYGKLVNQNNVSADLDIVIDDFSGPVDSVLPWGTGALQVNPTPNYLDNGVVVPAKTTLNFSISYHTTYVHQWHTGDTTFTSWHFDSAYTNYPSALSSDQTNIVFADSDVNSVSILDYLKQLVQYFTGDSSGNQELSDDSASISSTAESVHNQEQSWYSQNEAAINETGLSSYSLDGSQSFAMSTVKSQFTTFWNALGPIKNTYVLVLTISLATHILRHSPRRRPSTSGSSSKTGGGGKS